MDAEAIKEVFAEFGSVSVRRMFGGAGIFADGMMIGLVSNGVIYLKADGATVPEFEREGQGPFTYATRAGTRSLPSYWRMPDRLYDDTTELAVWARAAQASAQRAAARAARASAGKARRRRTP